MVVFPKQICKRFLPETGESRRDKTFFLKINMEQEVCTSLGSMFHRRGALLVKEIQPANDAGWNGLKSPCCRPRVPCWCSWKLSFSRSNTGADCWWQRRMVVTSCKDQRWVKWVSFKFLISGETSCWDWALAMQRTAFLQSARRRPCGPVGMNGMVAEAAYSKSGGITETKNCLLAMGVNCLYERRKAPILRPTFLQIESTWGEEERLSSMRILSRRVCETSLKSSFCSKSRTPVGRPWHARECGAMTMATVLETLIDRETSEREGTRSRDCHTGITFYSWITMRRSLRERRVFDFVPSYLAFLSKPIPGSKHGCAAAPLGTEPRAPPRLRTKQLIGTLCWLWLASRAQSHGKSPTNIKHFSERVGVLEACSAAAPAWCKFSFNCVQPGTNVLHLY